MSRARFGPYVHINLIKNQIGKEKVLSAYSPDVRNLFQYPFKTPVPLVEKVVAINAREVDMRMMVQMSAFTIHGTRNPLDSIDGNEKFIVKFEIPPAAKLQLKNQLFKIGIKESNLFPDLEHLASELTSLQFDVRPPSKK